MCQMFTSLNLFLFFFKIAKRPLSQILCSKDTIVLILKDIDVLRNLVLVKFLVTLKKLLGD